MLQEIFAYLEYKDLIFVCAVSPKLRSAIAMSQHILASKLHLAVASLSHLSGLSSDGLDTAAELISSGHLAAEARTMLAARIESSWILDCSRAAEVRCAAALAASGHLTSVGCMHLRDLELPSCGDIPALARVVRGRVGLQNVTGDLGPLLANLTVTVRLGMLDLELDQAATSSLVLGLQRGVKWLKLGGGARVHLHTLLSYDGNGGCVEVRCDDDTADIYMEEMKAWAIRLNWLFGESGNTGILMQKYYY